MPEACFVLLMHRSDSLMLILIFKMLFSKVRAMVNVFRVFRVMVLGFGF